MLCRKEERQKRRNKELQYTLPSLKYLHLKMKLSIYFILNKSYMSHLLLWNAFLWQILKEIKDYQIYFINLRSKSRYKFRLQCNENKSKTDIGERWFIALRRIRMFFMMMKVKLHRNNSCEDSKNMRFGLNAKVL